MTGVQTCALPISSAFTRTRPPSSGGLLRISTEIRRQKWLSKEREEYRKIGKQEGVKLPVIILTTAATRGISSSSCLAAACSFSSARSALWVAATASCLAVAASFSKIAMRFSSSATRELALFLSDFSWAKFSNGSRRNGCHYHSRMGKLAQ